MTNFKNKMGLMKVDYYSSEKSIPVYKDHEYELISVYNNPTKKTFDAMAIMYFYLLDKSFQKPGL